MTPEQVIAHCAQTAANLLSQSTRSTSLEVNLAPVNGRPVEVYLVKKGVIASCSGGGAGCVFGDGVRYLLFADEDGAPGMPPVFSLDQRQRFVVLEEYAHALHGDVYTDHVAAMLVRTRAQWTVAERYATGYAAERLSSELDRAGNPQLGSVLKSFKAQNRWLFPSEPSYTTAFPHLADERLSW